MDFDFINNKDFIDFIEKNKNVTPTSLRLKKFKDTTFDINFAITQIACRNKAKSKLPSLYDKIFYPTDISIEQCTTETVAEFHGSLFKGCDTVYDFTCGLGIDSFFISQNAKTVRSFDINEKVAEIANENYKRLNQPNITAFQGDSTEVAKNITGQISAGFIDPSRRDKTDSSSRLYSLESCEPDVKIIIDSIKDKANFLIVKASPMIDITQTIKYIDEISDIWIISIKNDCKELLFKVDFKQKTEKISLHTINYENSKVETFDSIFRNNDSSSKFVTPEIGNYLYLPNSSIMKANLFGAISENFKLAKIAVNSHLYSGPDKKANFPGKIFSIDNICGMSKSEVINLRKSIKIANIACRNFPLSPDALKSKLKIKDGGEVYIFATTTAENKHILLICSKVY